MNRVGANAPGKALLCGEYAVLEGAPAVVAAVDRRVDVAWSDEAKPMPPEVEATLAFAQAERGAVSGSLVVDASQLRRDDVKLGLGSSAAAAVAAAGAVFATHGDDLRDPSIARQVLDCALSGHQAVAPQGSGVDVAASALGGFLRFQRAVDAIDTRPLDAPAGLTIALVWTGHAARTSDLVAKVYGLRERAPEELEARMGELASIAAEFASAFARGDAAGVVASGAAYGAAMEALGRAAEAPIVGQRLRRISTTAERFAGSAKPCGAGGGDVAIAFFVDRDAASAFKLACRDEGLHPIDVSWGSPGVTSS